MRSEGGKPAFMLAGVVFYLIALVAVAPASVMEWLLPRFSGGRLHVQGAQGSFWHGEATNLLATSAEGRAMPLGAVKWQALWLPVLRGELAVLLELATAPKPSRGVVAVVPGGIRLRSMDITLPVSMLTEFYPAWKIWQPGGLLEVHAEMAGIGQGGIHGVAEVRWQDASSNLSHLNPFGSYRLLVDDGKLNLVTLSGPLRLSGQGEWSARGGRFEGVAQADLEAKASLQDFMRLLGKEDNNGTYRISIATSR